MKRFMKGCAVTALIFAVLGSVLAFVGGSVAGRSTVAEVVEAVTRGRVKVDSGVWWNWHVRGWDGLVDAKLANLAEADGSETDYGSGDFGDDNPVAFIDDYEIKEGDVDRFCPGENISNLDIDVGACSFAVEPVDGDYIYLEAVHVYKFQSYLKEGTLHIKHEGKRPGEWPIDEDSRITLYVPDGYQFGKVEAQIGAGYLFLGDVWADSISLEAGAGEIDMGYVDVAKMDISIGAGSVTIDYMEADNLDAEIGMGQFQASGDIYRKADIECSMGDVTLYLEGAEESYNYQLDGAMGNIDIGSNGYSGFSQEKRISNGASRDIEVECSMGNVSILFEG